MWCFPLCNLSKIYEVKRQRVCRINVLLLWKKEMSRIQEKALCERILKDIHAGAAVVIINGRKKGTLSLEISNQKTLDFHLLQSWKR